MKPIPLQRNADQFVALVLKGIECWKQAGEIAARAAKDDPGFIDRVCKQCPDISPETVVRFQRIGEGTLYPRLCLSESPGVRRLRRLPYTLQEKHCSEPIEVLVKTATGYEPEQIDVRALTTEQATQVFDADRIRSISAQRAWLENRASKIVGPATQTTKPYRVVNNEIVCMQACRISKKEALALIAQMD